MTEISDDYEWPQPLKANLELLAKLQENEQVRQKVIEDIQKEVKKYLNDVDQFSGSTGYLPQTIDNSKELRSNILKTDGTYKHYETAFNDSDADKCVKKLIDNIFPLFGCLYYMYYECASVCSFIKGGDWYNERCDGSSGETDLNNWLTDETGKDVKSHDRSSILMIKRDFKQDGLSQNSGQTLFPPRTSTTALLYFKDGDQLQFALYYMLFLPEDGKWDNAQSGHAVLFLEAFCRMASGEQFKDMYVDRDDGNFKTACKSVADKISTLIALKIIVPVATENTTVKYQQLLEATHFWNYIGWLEKSISRLLVSLTKMNNDVPKWNENDLRDSKTFGPYPWGFTFYNGWESKTEDFKSKLQELITALSGLQNALSSISEGKGRSKRDTDSSSPASTVGSVIGGVGAAAATAGAAYAGSGFLGSAAEGIGRFFKGLFF